MASHFESDWGGGDLPPAPPEPKAAGPRVKPWMVRVLGSLLLGGLAAAVAWRMGEPPPRLIAAGVGAGLGALLLWPVFAWVSRRTSTAVGCLGLLFTAGFGAALVAGLPFLLLFALQDRPAPRLLPTPTELVDAKARGLNVSPEAGAVEVARIWEAEGAGGLMRRLWAAIGLGPLITDQLARTWPPTRKDLSPDTLWQGAQDRANPLGTCVDRLYPGPFTETFAKLAKDHDLPLAEAAALTSDALLFTCVVYRAEAFVDLEGYLRQAAERESAERLRLVPREGLWPDPAEVGACWNTPFDLLIRQRGLLRTGFDKLALWRQGGLVAWSEGKTWVEIEAVVGQNDGAAEIQAAFTEWATLLRDYRCAM